MTTKTQKQNQTEPRFQPGSATDNVGGFSTAEIWWWTNGKWGECGYALPNDGGKPVSGNETMRRVVNFIGAELFNLMHRPDVKFRRPFNVEWLRDFNKMLSLGQKRLGDHSVGFTDNRSGDAAHAINTNQSFTVYPVPFFGQRIRQTDARYWCGELLLLLSEMIQHSDNDYDNDVTDFATSFCQEKLTRIQADMAMKYLGFSREQTEAADFVVPDTALAATAYNPAALFTDAEMISERMPNEWWPTANDLTPINGIPLTTANLWAERWPIDRDPGDGGAVESAYPGDGTGRPRRVKRPGA